MGRWKHDERDKKAVGHDELDKIIHKVNTENSLTPIPPPENWRATDSVMIVAPGYWKIHSKVDRRWRAEGKSEEVGGTSMAIEAKAALQNLWDKYGRKNQPWDLTYVFEPRDLKKFKLAGNTRIN
jgi:hypothetical protein